MFSNLLLVVIYLAFISLGLPDSLIGAAWPSMYRSLGVPISFAGILSTIVASGTIVSSISSDRLIRRFGVAKITLVSVLMTALALIGFAVFNHFLFLCLVAIPLGLGAGAIDSALNNYVANHHEAKHMSWLHCFWGVGATIGPMIMGWSLVQYQSWHLGYWIIGLIQLMLVVVLFFSLPLWDRGSGLEKTADSSNIIVLNLPQIFQLKAIKPVLLAFFCYCAIEASVGLWGGSYLVKVQGFSPEKAAQWVAVYYFGITFGRFLSGFLMMRFSTQWMIRVGQGLIGLGALVLTLSGASLSPIGLFLIGLGCAPIFPSLLHETPLNFGAQYSQSVMGVQMAFAYVGTTLMPPLFGVLATYIGYQLLPWFVVVILAVMVVMIESLRRQVPH